MGKLFNAIIASTTSPQVQIDAKRTDIVFSEAAVEMVNKQLNVLKDAGMPLKVYDNPAKKGFKPIQIGEVVSSELRYDSEYMCKQCVAGIYLTDDSFVGAIDSDKKAFCFIPSYGYNNQLSLQESYSDGDNKIYTLVPPLKIMMINVAEKRSSSNPHYIIL